jgi:hypothetical protein
MYKDGAAGANEVFIATSFNPLALRPALDSENKLSQRSGVRSKLASTGSAKVPGRAMWMRSRFTKNHSLQRKSATSIITTVQKFLVLDVGFLGDRNGTEAKNLL